MLMPTSWSPDGKRIAGPIAAQSGRFVGVGIYDLAARTMTPLCDDQTAAVRWLPDGRRLVYFAADGAELVTLDTVTKERRVVPVQLPGPSAAEVIALSPRRTHDLLRRGKSAVRYLGGRDTVKS
jgi:hypothetical protein